MAGIAHQRIRTALRRTVFDAGLGRIADKKCTQWISLSFLPVLVCPYPLDAGGAVVGTLEQRHRVERRAIKLYLAQRQKIITLYCNGDTRLQRTVLRQLRVFLEIRRALERRTA